jgi:DNA-binding response OmpR family regulator
MAMRILIVEDHPRMRGAMRLVLEEEGFQIDEAGDGLVAIESVRGDPPALVLLDLNIPGASG